MFMLRHHQPERYANAAIGTGKVSARMQQLQEKDERIAASKRNLEAWEKLCELFLDCRRNLLRNIAQDAECREARDTLAGPIDWELAAEGKPQPDEPCFNFNEAATHVPMMVKCKNGRDYFSNTFAVLAGQPTLPHPDDTDDMDGTVETDEAERE